MNITTTLIDYLDESTPLTWYRNAPVNAPVQFGTIQRDGGESEIVRDLPTVTLIVYAATDGEAEDLAQEVKRALLLSKWEIANIFEVQVEGMYNDPLDGKHRHRITATLITND